MLKTAHYRLSSFQLYSLPTVLFRQHLVDQGKYNETYISYYAGQLLCVCVCVCVCVLCIFIWSS